MNTRIEEPLPSDPLAAQAVLHVRRKLRGTVRQGTAEACARALALLFGFPEQDDARFRSAAQSARPLAAAAEAVADAHGVAMLGHDAEHVERCRGWLLREKGEDDAFSHILAYDLGTLLALSRARDLAAAGEEADRAPVPLLVRGETGTGKELLAEAIHRLSGRANGLHVIHVAGMEPSHVNDELFGHVEGAFTDAKKPRKGRIEEADGGTLLVDEIGDLSAEAQVRFLRVLQDGSFSRIGENQVRKSNVRIVAATWHDLRANVEAKKFRQDLYHRVCVGELTLPPLRNRRDEIRRLLRELLKDKGGEFGLTRSAEDALLAHDWPGNLRELDGVLRMAVASARGAVVRVEDLPPHLQALYLRQPIEVRAPGFLCDDPDGTDVPPGVLAARVRAVELQLTATTPAPDLPEVVTALFTATEALPDPSGSHTEVLVRLRQSMAARQAALRGRVIGDRLVAIAAADDLPVGTALAIEEAANRVLTQAAADLEVVEKVREGIDLTRSPLLRLYTELAALPLLKDVNHSKLLEFIGFVIQLVQSVAPEAVEQAYGIVQTGGLKALIAHGKDKLLETALADAEDVDDEAVRIDLPSGPARSWTRAEWVALVEHFQSRRDLEAVIELDGKTIKRHLDRHGIAPPWARRPS